MIKGEPDASSFPNGGIRSTFEARGYTAWDPTSFAFIKDGVLYIPSVFCSYSGASLDKKTPLLKSIEVVSKQALRVLKLFGSQATHVKATVGAEQEYFLVDQKLYQQRRDLLITGRTLFGARPSKGQEMDDHYFGHLESRVQAFMNELNQELWKLGILAKTQHKEAAPGQYELAAIYTDTNTATDHNQLMMELMQQIALRHGFACLLHEKPFAGVNGSGKHNNWSLSTNLGENLLEPGETPAKNAQFLVFLLAVIQACDEYQDLLRISASSASNDHRLGGHEAPPAIVSIFLGSDLQEVLDALERGEIVEGKQKSYLKVGSDVLPAVRKDNTDRNRTSPMAFTGNKFEFRMLGSSFSISCTNQIMNTIVAEELKKFADEMEQSEHFEQDLNAWIVKTIKEHKKIIFNGNGYDEAWVQEAHERGLLDYTTTVDAIPHYMDQKNVELFTRHGIFSKEEMQSRCDTLLENYIKTVHIEALTMVEMVRKEILPGVMNYMKNLAETLNQKKQALPTLYNRMEVDLLHKISLLNDEAYERVLKLEEDIQKAEQLEDTSLEKVARFHLEHLVKGMEELRVPLDQLEQLTAKQYWTLPTYEDLLL